MEPKVFQSSCDETKKVALTDLALCGSELNGRGRRPKKDFAMASGR